MKTIKKVLEPKFKWAVAGLGNFAVNSIIPAIKSLRRSRLVAVYSHSIERAKEVAGMFSIKEYYDDFEKFLLSDFDAVYIASANQNHYEQVIASAKAGKHIICEKPLALNSQQAEEMVKVCEENNVKLSVGYVQRFHPLTIKAKEILESGLIGQIVIINISQAFDYPPNPNYRYQKEFGGGALRDVGTHCIDLLRFFGGEIEQIHGYVDNVIYKSEVDDFVVATCKFKDGGYGNFYASFCIGKPLNRIEIVGYKGTIVIENLIGKKFDYAKLTIQKVDETKKAFRMKANKIQNLIKNFQKAVLENEPLLVTGYDGWINLKLIEEIEKSELQKRIS
ncbi:MAG: Gfo/Idh/MocA family oxidoreductase [Ignavibacteria bacterium]|nr:Gfo/Idh/MocA family oxidoreductase [Ignavibacteria bacterium]